MQAEWSPSVSPSQRSIILSGYTRRTFIEVLHPSQYWLKPVSSGNNDALALNQRTINGKRVPDTSYIKSLIQKHYLPISFPSAESPLLLPQVIPMRLSFSFIAVLALPYCVSCAPMPSELDPRKCTALISIGQVSRFYRKLLYCWQSNTRHASRSERRNGKFWYS